jgi:hypothetical protein
MDSAPIVLVNALETIKRLALSKGPDDFEYAEIADRALREWKAE